MVDAERMMQPPPPEEDTAPGTGCRGQLSFFDPDRPTVVDLITDLMLACGMEVEEYNTPVKRRRRRSET